jgi:flagellar protein FlbT
MYIDEANLATYHKAFWELAGDLVKAAPRTVGLIDGISEMILQRNYYQALKLTKRLIDYEQEVLRSVPICVESV